MASATQESTVNSELADRLNSLNLNQKCEQGLFVMGGIPKRDGQRVDRLRFNSGDDEDAKGTWISKCAMNSNRSYFGAVAVNGLIYVIGGRGAAIANGGVHNSIDFYNPDTNEWKSLAGVKPKHKRSEFGLAALEGKIYIVGGYGDSSKSVECLDIKHNEITDLPELDLGRWALGVTVCHGRIYACGGQWYKYQEGDTVQHQTTKYFNNVESYDPLTRKWTQKEGMLRRRGYFGLVTHENFLYAVGGMGGECNQRSNRRLDSIERFDTYTGQWTMIDTRLNTGISNLGLAVVNSKLLAIGGIKDKTESDRRGEHVNTVQMVDLKHLGSTDQGTTAVITTPLPSPRHSFAVTTLGLKITYS